MKSWTDVGSEASEGDRESLERSSSKLRIKSWGSSSKRSSLKATAMKAAALTANVSKQLLKLKMPENNSLEEQTRVSEGKRLSRSYERLSKPEETFLVPISNSRLFGAASTGEKRWRNPIVFVAANGSHGIVVTSDGKTYGQGRNESGQLDSMSPSDTFEDLPQPISEMIFENKVIRQVAVGASHSVFLTSEGYVITFGQNDFGQLGHSRDREPFRVPPRMVQKLGRDIAVQVACSENSTFVLTSRGKVFSFGLGRHGVLGQGDEGNRSDPKLVAGVLEGNPIAMISAGSSHVVALSVTGHTFAWGSNESCQLGLDNIEMSTIPIKVPMEKIVKSVAAGNHHTIMLSVSGKLYGCGQNTLGQLGMRNVVKVVVPPRKIHAATDLGVVEQIAAGISHSVALLDSGKVLVLGYVEGPESLDDENQAMCMSLPKELRVLRLTGGGDTTYVLASPKHSKETRLENLSASSATTHPIMNLTAHSLEEQAKQILADASKNGNKRKSIRNFKRQVQLRLFDFHTLNNSFLKATLGNNAALDRIDVRRNSCIDLEGMRRGFTAIYKALSATMGPQQTKLYLREQMAPLVAQLDEAAPSMTEPDQLRVFLILLVIPFSGVVHKEHELLVRSLERLSKPSRDLLFSWIKHDVPTDMFKTFLVLPILELLDNLLTYHRFDNTSEFFCKILGQCFKINEARRKSPKYGHRAIKATEFYSRQLASTRDEDLLRLFESYQKALHARATLSESNNLYSGHTTDSGTIATAKAFTIFDYPFLLSASAKRKVLQMEDHQTMIRNFLISQMFQSSPFFALEVRRDHILEDTILKLRDADDYLKKPLRVKFAGEEGLDAGGVKKEFFQLLSARLFSPNYGMFYEIETPSGPKLWFRQSTPPPAESEEYINVGVLIGLAVYNSTLIDVAFPEFFYRMLLGKVPANPGLDELEELDPVYTRSLRNLLKIEDEETIEMLYLNFTTTRENFGTHEVVPLKEGGEDIPVTKANLKEYISLLCRWMLVDSVLPMSTDLKAGFNKVVTYSLASLRLFEPSELELATVGSVELNFEDLKSITTYEGGYGPSHPTIIAFWKVALSLSQEEKELFMSFSTGSPRAPVGGLKTIAFKIQRAGPDSERLVSSSTCFNTLLLPDYATEEKLRRKLLSSIEHNMGFGNE